jgi:hypothetical protein
MRLKARSGIVALGTVLFIIFGFSSETRGSEFLLLKDEPALQSIVAENAMPSLPAGFPSALRSRAVALNPVIASSNVLVPGDVITLNLFADTVLTAQVDRVSKNVNGTVTVRGRIKDYPLGYLIISTTNNNSLASIQIPETGERYRIQMNTLTGIHYLLEENTDQLDELEDGPTPIPPLPTKQEAEETRMLSETTVAGPLDTVVNLDVMIVYTPAARSWAGGASGIADVIAQAVAKGQLALDNSNTALTITLVYSGEISYTESGDSGTDLDRLTNTSEGYMDSVHTLRNQYGADVVGLFTKVEDTGGIGWLLNTTSGQPAYAFSISRVQQVGWTYTYIHEMGHNMGCGHRKDQATQPGPGLFTYSAGWHWTGNDSGKYCSVMSYEDGGYSTVAYFSNPSILYQGVATGNSADGDNARTIREVKNVVSTYRTSTYTLSVNSSGASSVSIGSSTGHGGTTNYTKTVSSGTTVTLTAPSTASGKTFSGWTGDVTNSNLTISFAMSGNKSVTANYTVVNDMFANAITISGSSGQTTGSNVGATKESGEPSHAGNPGGASVWWKWTAPSNGQMTINTFGSSFDTLLGVYTGSSVGSLTLVASDDDGGDGTQSLVTFNAVSGTTYRIAVDGYSGATGNIILNWSLVSTYTLSVNSSGALSVSIGSSTGHEGTTNYTKTITSGTSVNLQAPQYVGSGASRTRFNGWTGSETSSSQSVTFTMDGNKTVTADYIADSETFTISGHILEPDNETPVEGVQVDASYNGGGTDITDANGLYELVVPYGWSGTATLTKEGYTFEPNSVSYNNVIANEVSDYTATLSAYVISGHILESDGVTAISDVNVVAENGGGLGATDPNGRYEVVVDYNWSGKVTPTKYAYGFEPNSRLYANVVQDQNDQDYTGRLLTFVISGFVRNGCNTPIEGVAVSADNGGGTGITDPNGRYEVWVDYDWSGTVTPGKVDYTFVPANMSYANVLGDTLNQDYLAINIYDLDCNGSVGSGDLMVIAQNWLKTSANVNEGDFNNDAAVNLLDFAMFAQHWLEGQ